MSPQYHSQLYRQLREVDPRDAQRIIRMYEEKEREIGRLAVEEYFELTVYYSNALFSTGAYRQHLLMVDLVIQACIEHNLNALPEIEGDVFEHLLFHKAVSAYRLRKYDQAAHVSRELIRINPQRELYVRFLRIILFRSQHKLLQAGRGLFIFCILLSAAIITLQLLLVKPFFPGWELTVRMVTLISFVSGIVLLLGVYLFAHFRAHRRAFGFRKAQGK